MHLLEYEVTLDWGLRDFIGVDHRWSVMSVVVLGGQ